MIVVILLSVIMPKVVAPCLPCPEMVCLSASRADADPGLTSSQLEAKFSPTDLE
jgi:hypothetical protein